MGSIFLASGLYSWIFVIWFYLGLGLFLSSFLNFCLLLPLIWAFYKASAMMRIAGFGYGLSWLTVVILSQAGFLMGLFLGLWTADAL